MNDGKIHAMRTKRGRLVAAIPISIVVGGAIWLAQDLINPPYSPGTPSQLGMPGDRPADQVQRPQTYGLALELRGVLAAVSAESVLIRRQGEVDAEVFLTPETAITLEGEPTTFDDLQLGGEVLVIFDLDGQRRIATSLDASLPGRPAPRRNAADPIVPTPPGADVEDGLLPDTAPEMSPAEEPP